MNEVRHSYKRLRSQLKTQIFPMDNVLKKLTLSNELEIAYECEAKFSDAECGAGRISHFSSSFFITWSFRARIIFPTASFTRGAMY